MFFFAAAVKKVQTKKKFIYFNTAITESALTSSIVVWYSSVTKQDIQRMQRIIRTTERVIGCDLTPTDTLYSLWARKKAAKLIANFAHHSPRSRQNSPLRETVLVHQNYHIKTQEQFFTTCNCITQHLTHNTLFYLWRITPLNLWTNYIYKMYLHLTNNYIYIKSFFV